MISKEKIYPDSDKIEIIQNIKSPENKKKLQMILGLFNYYRNLIDNHSSKVSIFAKKNNSLSGQTFLKTTFEVYLNFLIKKSF